MKLLRGVGDGIRNNPSNFGKDYSKSYELISMNFLRGVRDGIRNNPSNFGKDYSKSY